MQIPETIRLTAEAQEALGNAAQALDGVTIGRGLSAEITPARLVEAACVHFAPEAERDPEGAMELLVRLALLP